MPRNEGGADLVEWYSRVARVRAPGGGRGAGAGRASRRRPRTAGGWQPQAGDVARPRRRRRPPTPATSPAFGPGPAAPRSTWPAAGCVRAASEGAGPPRGPRRPLDVGIRRERCCRGRGRRCAAGTLTCSFLSGLLPPSLCLTGTTPGARGSRSAKPPSVARATLTPGHPGVGRLVQRGGMREVDGGCF
jgi:hypothetical protein